MLIERSYSLKESVVSSQYRIKNPITQLISSLKETTTDFSAITQFEDSNSSYAFTFDSTQVTFDSTLDTFDFS